MNESNQNNKPTRVQIITPVYNEEASLSLFVEEVRKVLFSVVDYEFRVLFIEDGSNDRSWEIVKEICGTDSHFKGIRLSRNFGSHVALTAGFHRADGDVVCTLACDLQDPPEVILEFLEKWKMGAKIVWGKRRTRQDSGWRMLTADFFFRLVRRYAMPQRSKFTTGSFLLIDKQVAKCFREFGEQNRVTFALVAWTGFDQEVVQYDRKKRVVGVSGWNFGMMLKAMYDTFIGFSFAPIRIITIIGISVFALAFVLLGHSLVNWLVGNPLAGWTSLMVTITFLFGLQFLLIGVLGEYLYRIYTEALQRPLYFVSEETEPNDRSAGRSHGDQGWASLRRDRSGCENRPQ